MESFDKKQPKKEPAQPGSPHDRFCKVVLKRPPFAKALLEAKLPQALLEILDLATLHLSDTDRVNLHLEEDFTDIQFNCNTRDGEQVEIPFVLEHKSYKPAHGPYQYMNYQNGIWGWQVKTSGQYLTPVVPIIFYHGQEHWEPQPWKEHLKGWHEVFAPFTPPGGCIFISLSAMPDENIMQFRYGFMVAAFLLMKHRLDRAYLLEHLPEIFTFVESDHSEKSIDNRITNLKYALRYLQGLRAIKWQEAINQLRPLNLTFQVMDVLEEVKLEGFNEGIEKGLKKGREEGREEGREREKFIACRNMLIKGFNADLITGVLEVPESYILGVKRQMEKESEVLSLLKSGKLSNEKVAASLAVSPYLIEILRKKSGEK